LLQFEDYSDLSHPSWGPRTGHCSWKETFSGRHQSFIHSTNVSGSSAIYHRLCLAPGRQKGAAKSRLASLLAQGQDSRLPPTYASEFFSTVFWKSHLVFKEFTDRQVT
jgi:hypothetical protein